jgi:hypothetical protein
VPIACGGAGGSRSVDDAATAEAPAEVITRDINNDGAPDTVFIYVADGAPTHGEADTTGDGEIDLRVTYLSAEAVEMIAYDRDGNGRPDEWEVYDGARVAERRLPCLSNRSLGSKRQS